MFLMTFYKAVVKVASITLQQCKISLTYPKLPRQQFFLFFAGNKVCDSPARVLQMVQIYYNFRRNLGNCSTLAAGPSKGIQHDREQHEGSDGHTQVL